MTMPHVLTPALPELGRYISLLAKADYLQTQVHFRARSLVDFEYAETDAEVDEYCTALEQAEAEFPSLCQTLKDLREAEESLLSAFLSLMESHANRREQINIRNLRNGLHLLSIRKKVISLAYKYVG